MAALAPEQDLSRSPLFQVMVARVEPVPPLELPGIAVSPWAQRQSTVKFDLDVAAAGQARACGECAPRIGAAMGSRARPR
ncbi:MAG: hypothetical protein HC856_07730 [Pseudanabaena sp. RU_4_16]|nr:hypothetical protein [Pseudanabaena sp. RU_4_16]